MRVRHGMVALIRLHPALTDPERAEIVVGGGLITNPAPVRLSWAAVRRLLAQRQIAGICLGQFAVHSTLTFFLTWFPSYLVSERGIDWIKAGFMASLPYVAAFAGVLVAGFWSSPSSPSPFLRRGCPERAGPPCPRSRRPGSSGWWEGCSMPRGTSPAS